LIGRLARDVQFRGTGAGEVLLMDALKRAWHSSWQVGSYAVTIDAIDDDAATFYARYGFLTLFNHTNRLYLPNASIERLGL
jgi:predicted GNAT family N-acyltransferase